MNTVPVSTRANNPWLKQLLLSVVFGIALVALAIGVVLAVNGARNQGKVLNGVTINGLNLGGLNVQQAAAAIGRKVDFPFTGRITVEYGSQSWSASPEELGLYLDAEDSAQAAYLLGRNGSFIIRLVQQISIGRYGRPISPTFVYDQNKSQQFLANIAKVIDQPAVEASIALNGTDVVLTNGQAGSVLDMDASLAALSAQLETMQSGTVKLAVKTIQPEVLDATPAADLARQILSQPFTLTIPSGLSGDPVVIEPVNLAGMLDFKKVQDGRTGKITVSLDDIALRGYLIELAPKLSQTADNARFRFNDDTKIIELIKSATIGREINLDKSIAAIKSAIDSGQHSTEIVFDVTKPAVTDDMTGKDLGITELLHMEVSYFRGSSADRMQNIQIAASKFDGLLVPPGAVFSMSDAMGEVSLDNGYAEALIILGDQTIQGVGGGVCQVSTTLFRTAFFSGFPIVERHAHAYRVKYYEQTRTGHNAELAGLDATVFVPIVDLKFKNDSPYWLLMETYFYPGSQSLVWKFYSTKDGRTVDWTSTGPENQVDPPPDVYHENPKLAKDEYKQTDWAVNGADVTVKRTVYINGSVYFTDTFYTHYEAWPNGYDYGPGSQVPMPDSSNPAN